MDVWALEGGLGPEWRYGSWAGLLDHGMVVWSIV